MLVLCLSFDDLAWVFSPNRNVYRWWFLKDVIYHFHRNETYCWWTKSCTTKDGDYPIIYRVLTIPGGAGFRPSTVWTLWKMFTPIFKNTPQFQELDRKEVLMERWRQGMGQCFPDLGFPVEKLGSVGYNPNILWVFPKIGVPQNGSFIMEHLIKMDDFGVPLFSETSISWESKDTPRHSQPPPRKSRT